jgi:hypothetical protein
MESFPYPAWNRHHTVLAEASLRKICDLRITLLFNLLDVNLGFTPPFGTFIAKGIPTRAKPAMRQSTQEEAIMKRNGASGTGWGIGAVCLAVLLAASTLRGGTLNPFAYEASSYAASAAATYTFTYTTETANPNMIIYALFPVGFNCSAIGYPMDTGMVSVTVNGGPVAISAANSWGNDSSLVIRLADPNVAGGSNIVVTAQGIVNHATPGTYHFQWIRTGTAGGGEIDAPAAIAPLDIAAALTMAASPADGGTVEPAVGHYAYAVDTPVAITATADDGHVFVGWTVAGNATLGDADALTTTVTIHDDLGALVTANFWAVLKVACGSTFWITDEEAGLAEPFATKPKAYALYDHPFNGKLDQKASAKVLTKIVKDVGADAIQVECTKKVCLFDAKAQKAAEKAGVGADEWLRQDPAPQQDLFMTLRVAGKQIPDGDRPARFLALAVPVIDDIADGGQDTKGNDLLVITGEWFGTKAPKVWREFTVPGKIDKSVVVKRQAMKVVKPTVDNTTFVDAGDKPSCMQHDTGESKLIVIIPAKDPKGTPTGSIVLDNGVGIASVILPPAAP